MPNPNPAFTYQEYLDRLTRTRAAMSAAGIEVLLVTDPSNMAWLSGYDGWSFYVHQGVLLGPDGDPRWWGRGIDGNGALRTVYMADDHIHGYADDYVQNPDKHPMEDLSKLIADLGWSGKTLGVEMDNYYFSASAYTCLVEHAPVAAIKDATGLVNWQRAVKSETEITYMRRAARIVEEMHACIRDIAEVGMKKNDLVAEIYRTSIRGADGHWGDYPAIVPMAPSGLDATAPHLTWDDAPLKAGETTFFEIAGAYRRYQCPQSRTLFFGELPDRFKRAEEAVSAATAAVFDGIKPGNLCEDVARIFNETIAKFGFVKDNRCGYPIGISYPPDWGERTMSFRAGDKRELVPGMTFHFMPALWLEDGGVETTEPIVVGENGLEKLCNSPSGIVVKPA